MAALRTLEAESVFCEQMVEHAEAASFRNRWDRDRLWLWQQREREAAAKISAEVKKPGAVTEGESRGVVQRPGARGDAARQNTGLDSQRTETAGQAPPAGPTDARSVDDSPSVTVLPDPTLFDREEAA